MASYIKKYQLKKMHRFRLRKTFTYFKLTLRLFVVAKNPFNILLHYIKETSPEFIYLRNGMRIKTSSNPHDVITFILVFCRQDYGKIKKDSFIVDVGANIGLFSMYSVLNGANQIEAFEPCEETYYVLKENIEFNNLTSKITLHNKAVTDTSNSEVFIPKKSSPYNKIHQEQHEEMKKVQTINLEDALSSITKIDLIKMDCEGAEFQIFPSLSTEFMDRVHEIRMELHGSLDKFLSCFDSNSFRLIEKTENGLASDIWLVKN